MAATVAQREDPELDEDVRELAGLFGRTVGNLKQRRKGPPPPLHEALEQGALGPRHMPVLAAVALEGGLSVSQLAGQVGLSVATTSLLVGELSRAGLLVRTEDERDRRRTIVTLDERHRETLEEALGAFIAPLRRTLARLSPRARASFIEGWRILAEESEGEETDAAPAC
jgi:DNA-binding MarR family transcriptional regulator